MNRLVLCFVVICAFIADSFAASVPLTDCQRRREREQRVTQTQNLTGLVVPECDQNGEYLPKQCFGQAVRGPPFCACYDKEFGQIKGPSRNIKSCYCIRAHHEWEHSRRHERGSAPRCNTTSGEYHPVQCSETHHWCVDTDTGDKRGTEIEGGCRTNLNDVTCGIEASHHGHESAHGESGHHDTSSHRGGSSHHGDTSSRDSGSRHQGEHSGSSH